MFITTVPTPPAADAPEPRTVRRKLYKRTCPECAAEFKGGLDSMFCCEPHKTAWWNRMKKRGGVAMPFLLAWREGRGSTDVAKYAHQQLSALADAWNAEDKAAGRRTAASFVERKRRMGWRAVDLTPGGKPLAKAAQEYHRAKLEA